MTRLPTYYEREQRDRHQKEETTKNAARLGIAASLFALAWILAGLAAFVMSIICFGRSGSVGQHIVGFLLAMFFGPFYWIFYGVSPDYCNKISVTGIPGLGGRRNRR